MSIAQGIYVRVSTAQIAESVRIKNLFRERLVASRLLWPRILHVTPCVKKSVKIYWSKSGFHYYESGMCMDYKIWCLFLFLCIGCHVYILTFSLSRRYRINFTIYENRSHDLDVASVLLACFELRSLSPGCSCNSVGMTVSRHPEI